METENYIGLMSGTSMDGVDAVLIRTEHGHWHSAQAHAFTPYPDSLKQELLALQDTGSNELHRSAVLAQTLSRLYAQTVNKLLDENGLQPENIRAIGCHGQTVRHAPQQGYSIQLADLPLLAELSGIFTVGDFRSRDLAAGGQGAPLVPAFHRALFRDNTETRVVLNIGGISNISVLAPDQSPFGFDTGPGNMLMDSWIQHTAGLPYDNNGETAARGDILDDLLHRLLDEPYLRLPHPKSTGRELFSLSWLKGRLKGGERPQDIMRTLVRYTARTISDAIASSAPEARALYICGGGIRNPVLTADLRLLLPDNIHIGSTAELNLDPQWVEAAAFGWLASCWVHRIPSAPHHATGAHKACILGCGYYA